jgi:hypothetical protein
VFFKHDDTAAKVSKAMDALKLSCDSIVADDSVDPLDALDETFGQARDFFDGVFADYADEIAARSDEPADTDDGVTVKADKEITMDILDVAKTVVKTGISPDLYTKEDFYNEIAKRSASSLPQRDGSESIRHLPPSSR